MSLTLYMQILCNFFLRFVNDEIVRNHAIRVNIGIMVENDH